MRFAVLHAALLLAPAAAAQIVPMPPTGFGPTSVTEDFEGLAGVAIPATGVCMTPSFPIPYDFGNGAQITGGSTTIYDYAIANPGCGWGLGLFGGSLGSTTPTVSPTAWVANSSAAVTFAFDPAVRRVGLYVEAANSGAPPSDGRVRMEAFDAGGVSLGEVRVQTDGVSGGTMALDTWLGADHNGGPLIASVRVSGSFMVFDDLLFEAGICQLDLGYGGPGTTTLAVCGQDLLTAGNQATLMVSSPSLPSLPGVLAVGAGFTPTPFLGGTLVPSGPPLVLTSFTTDGAGDWSLPLASTGTAPIALYAQAGVVDLTLPGLVQLSNAVQVTITL